MSETLNTRIQLKRDTSANWNAVSATFVLLPGELGFETDTGFVKIGTGATWGATPYISIDKYTSVSGLSDVIKDAADQAEANAIEAAAISVGNEQTRAEGVETALSAALSSEVKRAGEAERALADDFVLSVGNLVQDIADEAKARNDADKEVSAAAALSVLNLSTDVYDKFVKYADVNGGKSAITETNKIATLADVVGLSGVVHFRGADAAFEGGDGSVKPNTAWYADHDPVEGDIVINNTTSKEYLFTGVYDSGDGSKGKWLELGDEGLYATKAELSDAVAALESADAAIRTALDAEAERADDAEQAISAALGLSVGNLVNAITDEADARGDADDVLSDAIGVVSAGVDAVSAALTGEVDTRSSQVAALSAAIDGKVKVQKIGGTAVSTDLSVVELSEEAYMAKVVAGNPLVNDGVLYVMKPTGGYAFNAASSKIVNVAAPSADTDAANKKYVDDQIGEAELTAIELNGLSFSISGNKATLDISAINCGTASV